jgi:uncharacterized protein
MAKIAKSKIQRTVNRLAETYHPVAIYLFGSYAWGKPNEDSDVDLMIIVSDETNVDWDFKRNIKRVLLDIYDFPLDIAINKKTNFMLQAEHPSSLQFKIAKEGKKLYELT